MTSDAKWLNDSPLFMTELPATIEESAPLSALQALKAPATPEEAAEQLKDEGNRMFKKGQRYYREAIDNYTAAIDQKCANAALTSMCYSNRAAVNLALGNYGKVLADCEEAVKLNASNVKACWRGAKAAIQLDKFDVAFRLCQTGLNVEPENAELKAAFTAVQTKGAEYEARREASRIAEEAKSKAKAALDTALKERNVVVGPYQFDYMADYPISRPAINPERNEVSWPALFLYDEYAQSDYVEHIFESDTFGAHLEYMFGHDAPKCNWDLDRTYLAENLEVYVRMRREPTRAGTPVRWRASRAGPDHVLVQVPHVATLAEVLRDPRYVVPGFPVFHVLVAHVPFRDDFLKQVAAGS